MVTSRPDDRASTVGVRLGEARRIIDCEYVAPITTDRLARRVRLPRRTFQRIFEQAFGVTPQAYLRKVRAQRAAQLLEDGHDVPSVCAQVGYRQQSTLEADYRRVYRGDTARLHLLDRAHDRRAP